MLQEAAEELFQRESHGAALAVMGVVLPAKGDLIAVHRKEAVIRDRHAMGADSGEGERSFRREAERRSGLKPNTIGA